MSARSPNAPIADDEARLVARLMLEAGCQGEALISVVRVTFCLLVLARYLTIEDASLPAARHALEVPLLLGATVASLGALRLSMRHRLTPAGLVISALADAVVCFLSLLSNVLWTSTLYPGLLRTPDVAVLMPVVFMGALRLSPAATLASLGGNLLGFGLLVGLDLRLNPSQVDYGATEIEMVLIFLLTIGGVAWQLTRAARSLVERTGKETARLAHARRHIDALLREHHDVRTLLSTARLNVQMLRQQRRGGAGDASDERLAAIEQAVIEMAAFVEGVKSQSLAEIALIEGRSAADAGRAARRAVDVARLRFPCVRIEFDGPHDDGPRASIVGGERSLTQLLFNLLVNACEGDGTRGATCVRLTASCDDRRVVLTVRDDGPGFARPVLSQGVAGALSTKTFGSGLGLALVGELVKASGGRIELANDTVRGAIVTITLALAPA